MKVLHVITGLSAGGAETQLDLILEHGRHTYEVAALYNVGRVGRRIAGRGVPVHDLDMSSNRHVLRVLRLARIMRRGGYDVVHVHLYRACIYGRVAAALAGVPVVVTTEHSLGDTQIEGRPKTRLVRALYLATARISDATVAVSPRVRERLLDWGLSKESIRVVPNGLDFERFAFDPEAREAVRSELGIPAGDFVAGYVGRLHPLKRNDLLIRAAATMLERGGWLVLVGEGEDGDRLQRLARQSPRPERVILTGERQDVPALLSTLDLLVSLSEEETFGLAVLEALASGARAATVTCPALDSARADGMRRISGEIGELQEVLLLEQRGHDGRAPQDPLLRQRYDIRSVAAALDGLYESLLAGRPGSGAA